MRGFIQIPILIAIIVVAVLGGGAYVAYEVAQPSQNASRVATTTPELSEIEKLRQEVDELKKQQSSSISQKSSSTQVSNTAGALPNTQIIERVKPATVYIETENGSGSGMIISSDGYILTNAHVVKGANSIKVHRSTGQVLNAQLVGTNEYKDVAVLKVSATGLPIVRLGNSDNA